MTQLTDDPRVWEALQTPQAKPAEQQDIDLDRALSSALATPVLYPPLKDSVFPGDSVAILLQDDLPNARQILESLIQWLGDSNVEATDITVVVSPRMAETLGIQGATNQNGDLTNEGQPPALIPVEFGFQTIQFQIHDPDNSAGQAYLAANAAGQPVYVNRTLVEADFVLPVASPTPGRVLLDNYLYPQFSGADARERFAKHSDSEQVQSEEVELANDMLGSFFVIQIVCGPGNTIREIVCGARKQATDQARLATNELWQFPFSETVDTVVATIESEAQNQTWDDVARSIVFANDYIAGDGPLVVWSDLDATPDKRTRTACQYAFDSDLKIDKLPPLFRQLANILVDRPVFLRSRLAQSVTESLGIGFLDSTGDVLRVTEPYLRRLLIRDAHKCQRAEKSSR